MEDKMKIHLLIDKERYPLTIRREEEQLYRDAAKQIDNKLNKYRRAYPEFSTVKHWAMAALELAFENMSMKDRNDTPPYAVTYTHPRAHETGRNLVSRLLPEKN